MRITWPAPQQPVVAPMNQVKRGNRIKQTYQAPEGSPLIWSRGEGSQPNLGSPQLERPQPEKSQPDPRSQPQRPEQPEEEERPWIPKPLNVVVESYRQVKEQYLCLEQTLESVSLYLDVEPRFLLEHIQALPKPHDLADLQARVDCLLKQNGELSTKVEEGESL